MGWPVVIYNAPYDLTVLDRECRRHGLATVADRCEDDNVELRVVDPLVIDKAADRDRKGSRTLPAVCAHHGIPFRETDAHTSHGDALAAARLAWVLAHRYPSQLGDLDDLQTMQAKWCAGHAASFEDYLRGRNAEDGASDEEIATVAISRDWPRCARSRR